MTSTAPNHAERSDEQWDAIVIGAGPSGALAARQIAQRGLKTLLVERKAFPRDKVCGGCVGRRAVELLRTLDLGDVGAGQGGLPISRMRVHRGARRLEVALSGGVAISRSAFDSALVEAAMRSGVIFRPETEATVTRDDSQTVQQWREVVLHEYQGKATTVAARVILAADGLGHSSVRYLPEFDSRIADRARIGLGAIMPAEDADYEAGTIHMAVGLRGYAGLVRVEGGRLNIAAAVDADFLREQTSPAATIARLLADAKLPIPAALETAAWQGTPPLTRHTPQLAERRLFLMGDAAGYVEPFTGEGIAWGLTAAVTVAPLATQACAAWDDQLATEWHRSYARLIGRRQVLCRTLAAVLRRRWAASATWVGLSLAPGLLRPLVRYLERSTIDLENCG